MPSTPVPSLNLSSAVTMNTVNLLQEKDNFQEVLLVTGERTSEEASAIKILLACNDDALADKIRQTLAERSIAVVPSDSFVARNHERLKDAGFAQAQRDGETVLRKTMPVAQMNYVVEHMVDGVHIFDTDTAVIEVTLAGMVTLSIGDGRYDEEPVDANTPKGLGILIDAKLPEPREQRMMSLVQGLRLWLPVVGLQEQPSPFPQPRRKFPRPR